MNTKIHNNNLTPPQIVEELDRYIIGQESAKRAVAIALCSRWRRQLVPEGLREEIMPNNIILIGSTGVGKTELARRLARLANAPLLKKEASKFTEVGYVGRDVESIIRDLVDISVDMLKSERIESVQDEAEELAATDTLTGLKNRRAMDHYLARYLKAGKPFTLMNMDLDFFRRFQKDLSSILRFS